MEPFELVIDSPDLAKQPVSFVLFDVASVRFPDAIDDWRVRTHCFEVHCSFALFKFSHVKFQLRFSLYVDSRAQNRNIIEAVVDSVSC